MRYKDHLLCKIPRQVWFYLFHIVPTCIRSTHIKKSQALLTLPNRRIKLQWNSNLNTKIMLQGYVLKMLSVISCPFCLSLSMLHSSGSHQQMSVSTQSSSRQDTCSHTNTSGSSRRDLMNEKIIKYNVKDKCILEKHYETTNKVWLVWFGQATSHYLN